MYKGHDRATIVFSQPISETNQQASNEPIDEIKMYLDARYISSSESIWRIFHYKMHGRTPNVQRLAIHLPNHQTVTFHEEADLHNIIEHNNTHITTLTAWFQENINNANARNYKYTDFPIYYT